MTVCTVLEHWSVLSALSTGTKATALPGVLAMELICLFASLPVLSRCVYFRHHFQRPDRVRVRGGSNAGRALCIGKR